MTACADDADLRAEVDSLLAAGARGDTFLEASALQVTARALASELPRLAVGQRVGSYEIQAPLGAGGMGEVYTARDTRLERTVAVKVLSPAYADNVGLASAVRTRVTSTRGTQSPPYLPRLRRGP